MKLLLPTYILCLLILSISPVHSSQPQPINHDGARIRGAVFSADNQQILSWGGDTARVWDVTSGDLLLEIAPKPEGIQPYPGGGLSSAQWNTDETTITVTYQYGSHSAFRSIWDVATGQQLESEMICTGVCGSGSDNPYWFTQSVDISGERIATWENVSCSDNCTRIVTINEPEGTTHTLPHQTNGQRIKHAYWSDSGHYLAVTTVPDCSENGDCMTAITLWDVAPDSVHYGESIMTASVPCIVWDIQWSDDDDRFFVQSDGWWREAFAGSVDTCAATWQSFSIEGELLWQYINPTWTTAYQMTMDNSQQNLIIIGSGMHSRERIGQLVENHILRLDTTSGNLLETQVINGFVPVTGRGNPYHFAYQLEDDGMVIWNVQTLEAVAHLQTASPLRLKEDARLELIADIVWATDYNIAYALTEDNQLYVWDTVSWELLFSLERDDLTIRFPFYEAPTPHYDGTTHLSIYGLKTACESNCIVAAWLFDLTDRQLEFSLASDDGSIGVLEAITDRIVANTYRCNECNAVIEIYDNQTNERLIVQEGNPRISIVETGDDWLITKASSDYVVPPPTVRHTLWNLETGVAHWHIDTSAFHISPTGESILIYGRDATTIHDFRTGNEQVIFPFEAGVRPIMDWSSDDRLIIFETGNGNYLADIYDATTGTWLFPNRQG